jgi:hypothetical protein
MILFPVQRQFQLLAALRGRIAARSKVPANTLSACGKIPVLCRPLRHSSLVDYGISPWPITDIQSRLQVHNYLNPSLSFPQPSTSTHKLPDESHKLPNISFLRKLFSTSAGNPTVMSAAKTKAQGIIDENAVG